MLWVREYERKINFAILFWTLVKFVCWGLQMIDAYFSEDLKRDVSPKYGVRVS